MNHGTDHDPALDWAASVLGLAPHELSIGADRIREWSRVRALDPADAAVKTPNGSPAVATAGAPPNHSTPARVWLKELPDGLRSELLVAAALSKLPHSDYPAPRLIAANQTHGWLLTEDGGPSLFDVFGDGESNHGADLAGPWERTLLGYAALQRAIAPSAEHLAQAGVPDLRPERLPALAERLVSEYAPDVVDALELWKEDARRLQETGIPSTLQHEDLHAGNVFASSLTPFDWGDASISHPWMSLAVAVQEAWEDAAQSAYLASWGVEMSVPDARAWLASARRLGCVSRAASWERVALAVGVPERFGDPVAAWLGRGRKW